MKELYGKGGSMNPTVSVVMPVYNAEKYLCDAIESILKQTFHDFEFIIIDDGSSDSTSSILNNNYNDKRIVYVKNDENKGIVYSLNRGLALSKGKYIARMDADDICIATRLAEQVKFLDTHPDIDICGAYVQMFSDFGLGEVCKYPILSEEIKGALVFNNVFAHPVVMMRHATLLEHGIQYNEKFLNAEDFGLWSSMLEFGGYANLPKVLLHYRVSNTSISALMPKRIMKGRIKVMSSNFNLFDIPNPEHLAELCLSENLSQSDFVEIINRLNDMRMANNIKEIIDSRVFEWCLNEFKLDLIRKNYHLGLAMLKCLSKKELANWKIGSLIQCVKHCIMRK